MMPIRELPYAPVAPPTAPARATPAPTREAAHGAGEPSPFAALVHGFAREADRGEATMRGVLGPARGSLPMDTRSLLALQAGIYRYGETMDLAARLVDKASSGVKTVVQGQ